MEAFPEQSKAWSPQIGDLRPKKQLEIPTRVEKGEEEEWGDGVKSNWNLLYPQPGAFKFDEFQLESEMPPSSEEDQTSVSLSLRAVGRFMRNDRHFTRSALPFKNHERPGRDGALIWTKIHVFPYLVSCHARIQSTNTNSCWSIIVNGFTPTSPDVSMATVVFFFFFCTTQQTKNTNRKRKHWCFLFLAVAIKQKRHKKHIQSLQSQLDHDYTKSVVI